MHLANIHVPLTWVVIVPLIALLGVVILVSLRKFNFVKIAFAVMFAVSIAGVIALFLAGSPEGRTNTFHPGSRVAMSSHFSDSRDVPPVPRVPSHAEMAHIDEAISRVHIDQDRFDKQMQLEINEMEGDVALSYVHDRKPSSRHLLKHSLRGRLGTTLVIGFVMFAFLYVCYLFLDAGTRGQFTWSLRIISLFAFIMMMIAIQVLHQRGSL